MSYYARHNITFTNNKKLMAMCHSCNERLNTIYPSDRGLIMARMCLPGQRLNHIRSRRLPLEALLIKN